MVRTSFFVFSLFMFSGLAFAEFYPKTEGKISIETPIVYNNGGLFLKVIIQDSCHYGECSGKPNLNHHFVIPVDKDGKYTIPEFNLNQTRGSMSVVLFDKLWAREMHDISDNISFKGPGEFQQFASGFTVENVKPTLSFDFQNPNTIEALNALFTREGINVSEFGNPKYTIDVEGYFQWEMKSSRCCNLFRMTTPHYRHYRINVRQDSEVIFHDMNNIIYPTYFKNFNRENTMNIRSVYARIYEWYSPLVKRAVKSAEVSLTSKDGLNIELGSKSKYTLKVE